MAKRSAQSFNVMSFLQRGLPDSVKANGFSFLITFHDGRVFAQPVNRRLTKADVADLLKTTEEGVAFLVKKGWLKTLGHPDESKQKLFSGAEFFNSMQDNRWLSKATDLLYEYTSTKNAARSRKYRPD